MAAFKKQEDDLLKYYKDEMYKSQRHLKDLTEEVKFFYFIFAVFERNDWKNKR